MLNGRGHRTLSGIRMTATEGVNVYRQMNI